MVLAIPIGSLANRIMVKALRKVPNLPAPIIQDVGRMARWAIYLIAFAARCLPDGREGN